MKNCIVYDLVEVLSRTSSRLHVWGVTYHVTAAVKNLELL